ncbi:hypothetical protein C5167_038181 [Papaver somniferum]|uniref:Peptidase A1 domain-containing protein n=1 Tax=Papaver somniferum TaxID=3469 RepID=A0A4Y7IBU9_PAPSO|nr:basic 7S globulin-like [Papaver somniferum]RZC45212.1 hypothetical protein C5167_038181 [Papaver somniferum]
MASFLPIQSSFFPLFFATTILLVFCNVCFSNAQPTSSSRPQGLVLPVTKDGSALQYLTSIMQSTPLVSESLVVDLAGEYLWVDCENGYVSSSNRTLNCFGRECSKLQLSSRACLHKPAQPRYKSFMGCLVFPSNKLPGGNFTSGYLTSDVVSTQSCINGSTTGPYVTARKFSFGCGSTSLLKGLANGVKGMAGFGPFGVSVPSQLSSAFRIPRVFAMCLPSSTSSKGVIFIGGGPYKMQPGIDLSTSFTYTPFYTNATAYYSSEYHIRVKSITVCGKKVPVDGDSLDNGFIKSANINTMIPYTVLRTSIYNAFSSIFIEKAKSLNITRMASVAPFGVCFDSKNMISTRLGALVPEINLVLHTDRVVWRIFGSNSMVQVSDKVSCLGFVDGGNEACLVIGGNQLEDNLLEFNLAKMRLGFTTTLGRQTTCSNFNFKI